MKKNKLIFAVVLLALVLYFRPLSFPELSFEDVDNLNIHKVDLLFENGTPSMDSTTYDFEEGFPEAEAIGEILGRYSYRRSLRTPFPNTDLEGNDAGFFLHIWGENLYISTSGTGEITVNARVYRMGLFGNRNNLAFMEEIAAVLAEAAPHDAAIP